MAHIICGKCHRHHYSVESVKECYNPRPAVITIPAQRQPVTEFATPAQLNYIKNLGGDPVHAAKLPKLEASRYIDRLKTGTPAVTNPIRHAPNRQTTIVPLDMLDAALNGGREGRFAVRPDSTQPFTFFRITKPKSGRFQGCMKVQTQHGPNYLLMMSVWPSGSITIYDKSYEQDLLLVCVDPNGGKIAYGQELGFCGICGKELTDPRSRWYGIGPDCEKRHGHLIEIVDGTKGVFKLGQS